MKRIGKKKSIVMAILCMIVLWIAMGSVDYFRVSNFERPIFCFLNKENSFDDVGYEKYKGLGYSVYMKGDFMPGNEYPGVTQYKYYIWGTKVSEGIRD